MVDTIIAGLCRAAESSRVERISIVHSLHEGPLIRMINFRRLITRKLFARFASTDFGGWMTRKGHSSISFHFGPMVTTA